MIYDVNNGHYLFTDIIEICVLFVLTWSEDKNESGLLTTDSHKRLPYETMEPLDFFRRSGKYFVTELSYICVLGVYIYLFLQFLYLDFGAVPTLRLGRA